MQSQIPLITISTSDVSKKSHIVKSVRDGQLVKFEIQASILLQLSKTDFAVNIHPAHF